MTHFPHKLCISCDNVEEAYILIFDTKVQVRFASVKNLKKNAYIDGARRTRIV